MAYETDQYGNRYYIPDAQYTGGADWGSGLTGALSAGATGAQLGAMLGGPAGALLGGGIGALGGGLYGLFTGTEEQNRLQADEAARIEALRQARKRMEQGFADERSALETQRQLAEQMNPAEALYGTQGRPGLLQAQQAMLAQQMAAQGARNRAALASRGLLGSGMEAATSGALAGQQAGAQAQLQANIAQQYMQQQQARQQQLGQLGLQQAQLTQRQAAARSAQDLGALQQQQQIAQQIAQRNQALLQSGLQAVGTGLGAYQQAQGLDIQRAAVNAQRAAAGLPAIDFGKPMFQSQAQQAVDFLGALPGQAQIQLGGRPVDRATMDATAQAMQQAGNFLGGIPGQINQGLQGAGQAAMSGLGQIGQGLQGAGQAAMGFMTPPPAAPVALPAPAPVALPAPATTPAAAPAATAPRLNADMRQLIKNDPYFYTKMQQQWTAGGYVSPNAGQLMPGGRMPTMGNPTYDQGPLDVPAMPPPVNLPTRPRKGAATTSSSGLGSLVFG